MAFDSWRMISVVAADYVQDWLAAYQAAVPCIMIAKVVVF